MEPEAPKQERRPRLTSTGRTVLTLVLLALLGATVGLVLLTQNRGEPTEETANASEFLQMREVLEVIQSSSPKWDSVTVTCFDEGGDSASGCLNPLAAADRSVVLLAADGSAKYRLGPALISAADVIVASTTPPVGTDSAWAVNIELTPDASKRFSDITTRLVGKQLALVVEARVVSAPTVALPITTGKVVIVGRFTEERAKALAGRLDPRS